MNICHFGDCRETMRLLIAEGVKVQTCVTSPPYFGLRDYGHKGQIGLEATPEEYIKKMVEVFSLVRELLSDDGTLWLNIGDSYAGSGKGGNPEGGKQSTNKGSQTVGCLYGTGKTLTETKVTNVTSKTFDGIKAKDLIGIPWMLAFALRADGWFLRSDIIWAKKNCMPESVLDRPTRSHEYIFLLSKSSRYYYDSDAIKEPAIYDVDGTGTAARKARAHEGDKGFPTEMRNGMRPAGYKDATKFEGKNKDKQRGHSRRHEGFNKRWDNMTKEEQCTGFRNKRDVWTVATKPYSGAHFAVFPEELIEPCILAGSRVNDIILDPFFGSGTTGQVAQILGRQWIGCELNKNYDVLQKQRTAQTGIVFS